MKPTLLARTSRTTQKVARPELTALVDLITILLVFLLKSFSVDGNFTQVNGEIRLPVSDKADRGTPKPTLQITPDEVLFNGDLIASLTPEALENGEELTSALRAKRIGMLGDEVGGTRISGAGIVGSGIDGTRISGTATAGEEALRDDHGTEGAALLIQCDKNHDFEVLGHVLRACSAAGFADLSLVTQREES